MLTKGYENTATRLCKKNSEKGMLKTKNVILSFNFVRVAEVM